MIASSPGQALYQVNQPRATDALAGTLRSAFADVPGLPAEMQYALYELDRIDARRRS